MTRSYQLRVTKILDHSFIHCFPPWECLVLVAEIFSLFEKHLAARSPKYPVQQHSWNHVPGKKNLHSVHLEIKQKSKFAQCNFSGSVA
jgi:hypothetical protein